MKDLESQVEDGESTIYIAFKLTFWALAIVGGVGNYLVMLYRFVAYELEITIYGYTLLIVCFIGLLLASLMMHIDACFGGNLTSEPIPYKALIIKRVRQGLTVLICTPIIITLPLRVIALFPLLLQWMSITRFDFIEDAMVWSMIWFMVMVPIYICVFRKVPDLT